MIKINNYIFFEGLLESKINLKLYFITLEGEFLEG